MVDEGKYWPLSCPVSGGRRILAPVLPVSGGRRILAPVLPVSGGRRVVAAVLPRNRRKEGISRGPAK